MTAETNHGAEPGRESTTPQGVSFVICCHNSAQLLPETLLHLSSQRTDGSLPFEVIVVDNASTDETSQVALAVWPSDLQSVLRVVPEPKPGLSNARLRGLLEARYPFVTFVDDDNHLGPEWLAIVSEVMLQNPRVAACGGQVEPLFEGQPPVWFTQVRRYFVVGPQGTAGDITETRGYLWGAGLCLRKAAWDELISNGFSFLLSDRTGKALTSGGDAELCYALRLGGWRLWYEPRLTMGHVMPASRLEWSYVRRISRAFGAATVGIDSYEMALRGEPLGFRKKLTYSWTWQTLATVRGLSRQPLKALWRTVTSMEGDEATLLIDNLWGRLVELLRQRGKYAANIERVRNAPWRRKSTAAQPRGPV